MANIVYNIAKQAISTAELDLSSEPLYLMLVSGYSPSIDNDHYVSAISSYETSGSGYSRQQLQDTLLFKDIVNNRMTLSADDVTWDLATFAADGAVIYVNSGSDASNMLVTYLDFGTVKSSNNTPFKITWSTAEGILNIR